MDLSCHSVGGNLLRNNEEITEVLERGLNIGSILHNGRRCVYEHLWDQGYSIARSVNIFCSCIRLELILFAELIIICIKAS